MSEIITLPVKKLEVGMRLHEPVAGLFPSATIESITGNYIFTNAAVGGAIEYWNDNELFEVEV